jgi:hypothetical protein
MRRLRKRISVVRIDRLAWCFPRRARLLWGFVVGWRVEIVRILAVLFAGLILAGALADIARAQSSATETDEQKADRFFRHFEFNIKEAKRAAAAGNCQKFNREIEAAKARFHDLAGIPVWNLSSRSAAMVTGHSFTMVSQIEFVLDEGCPKGAGYTPKSKIGQQIKNDFRVLRTQALDAQKTNDCIALKSRLVDLKNVRDRLKVVINSAANEEERADLRGLDNWFAARIAEIENKPCPPVAQSAPSPKPSTKFVVTGGRPIKLPCISGEYEYMNTGGEGTATRTRFADDIIEREHAAWTERLGRDPRSEEFSARRRPIVSSTATSVTTEDLQRLPTELLARCFGSVGINAIATTQPNMNYGTVIDLGVERPAGETKRRFNTTGFDVEVVLPAGGAEFGARTNAGTLQSITKSPHEFGFHFAYYEFDGSSSASVVPGTLGSAQTFITPDAAKVTGVNYGTTGASWNAQTKGKVFDGTVMYQTFGESFRYRQIRTAGSAGIQGIESSGVTLAQSFGLGARYRRGETDNTIRSSNITFPVIQDTITTKTTYNFFGANAQYNIIIIPAGDTGFTATLGGSFAAGALVTQASATENFVCPGLCAATEQNVLLHLDFDNTRFAYIAGARLELGYRFNRWSTLNTIFSFDHMSSASNVFIPTSPEQGPARLVYGQATTLSAGARYTINFGP